MWEVIGAIVVIGGWYILSRIWLRMMEIHEVIKQLDREIAADNLRTAQLEMIARNEQEANCGTN